MISKISEKNFEIAGTIVGCISSITIASQVYAEYVNTQPSTLSPFYVFGFIFIFIFWIFYGIRFRLVAIWLPNSLALFVQLLLLLVVSTK